MRSIYITSVIVAFTFSVSISSIAFGESFLRRPDWEIPTKVLIKESSYYLSESVENAIKMTNECLSPRYIKDKATCDILVSRLKAIDEGLRKRDKVITKRAIEGFIKEAKRQRAKGRITREWLRMALANGNGLLDRVDGAAEFVNYEAAIDFDPKSGNYIYRWRGSDGRPVVAIFEPATKVDVVVKAYAEIDSITRRYRYSYEVFNKETSVQDISSFSVEYGGAIQDIKAPKGWWGLSYHPQHPTWVWAATEMDEKAPPPPSPGGIPIPWARIKPGMSLKGFSFESSNPPGIVKCYSQGFTQPIRVPEEMPEELANTLPIGYPQNCVWGKTIGPVEEPKVFDRIRFSEYIASLARESFSLGWIGKKEILEDILSQLDVAGKSGPSECRGLLKAMISDIEKIPEEDISSEARSLLKLNILYLLERVE